MPSEPMPAEADPFAVDEEAIDAAIAACDGDVRGCIRSLLVSHFMLEALLAEAEQTASSGYRRKRVRHGVSQG